MFRLSRCEIRGELFGPRLGSTKLGLESSDMLLKSSYEQLRGNESVRATRGPPVSRPNTVAHPSGGRIRIRLSLLRVLCQRPRIVLFPRCIA
jgi:hypothetical protein